MAGTSPAAGLIDTNALVDGSRRRPDAVAFLMAAAVGGPPPVSIVTAMELVGGARDKADLAFLRQYLTGFTVHPVTPAISAPAMDLMVRYTLSHGLEPADALIAATALELGLPLYTLNLKHFAAIAGLTTLPPY